MMTQNNMLEWDQLSMKQRAAFIRNAVARGIYNVEDIVQDYNEFRKGGPMETPIYEDLPKMLRKAGLDIKVTSGYRPAGTVGNAGQRSWHHRHGAVDIVPQGNTTFEDIENVLHNNPAIRQYMLSHNFGLIDESGRTPESKLTMKKTGATGAHFHIGKDSKYAALYRQRVGAAQPEGDRGKTVYFTNPFLPLEQPAQQAQVQRTVTPEEILQNVTIPEPIKPDDDIQATAELPEVEVIGHQPQVDPLTILSQIQESAPAPLALEPYQIPQIQNKVNEIATERNSFLQKDLEDRILAEERRRRLGYSYRDNSIEDDIKQMQFLRNMSANGGSLSDSDYYDIMERVAKENNERWNQLRAQEGAPLLSIEEEYLRILNDNAYDYRGYYNKYPQSRANADTHWTDEFKTAFHPTFSIESGYSGKKSQYNPNGYLGGVWLKNGQFVPTFWQQNMFGGGGLMPIINVPAVAKNLYNKAKDRLYRTITPQGYHLGRAAKEFIKGDTRDFSKFTPAENEVWARYLGVPYEGESNFEKAIYTPTKGGATYDDVIKFKDESQILSDDVLRQLLQNQMKTGKNTMLVEGNESGLGTYTLSLGEDENGKYISYYDDWDINPTRGLSAKYKIPLIEQIGDIVPGSNPFTVYGRRYYTDEDLRRVIER